MRAWIFSDLYLSGSEQSHFMRIPDADICICSGGMCPKGPANAVRYLGERLSHAMPVILVPGNYEYHSSSIVEGALDAVIAAGEFPDVHLLDRKIFFFEGVRFIGATLWGDAALRVNMALSLFVARRDASDFLKIQMSRAPPRKFSSNELELLMLDDTVFLKRAMVESDAIPTVVVTHHAPSRHSIPARLRGDSCSRHWEGNLETDIVRWKPKLWVHGNLQIQRDYRISATCVICNPHGRRRCPVLGFDPNFIVDLKEP